MLPESAGIYSLHIDASQYQDDATFEVHLFPVPEDASAVIDVDGPPASLTVAEPGQNGFLSFTARGGERLFLTTPHEDKVSVQLLDPDGEVVRAGFDKQLAGYAYILNDAFTLPPKAGEYRVEVFPREHDVGEFSFQRYSVPSDLIVEGPLDGARQSFTITSMGQNAEYRFAAKGSERLVLTVTSNVDTDVHATVVDATGKPLGIRLPLWLRGVLQGYTDVPNCGTTATQGTDSFYELCTLPAVAGSYALRVDPCGRGTGTISVELSSLPDVVVDGALDQPGSVTIGRKGQNAVYRFFATRGARLAFRGTTSAGVRAQLSLLAPNGSSTRSVPAGEPQSSLPGVSVNEAGRAFQDVFTLPDLSDADTGWYALRVDPYGPDIGTFELQVFSVPAPASLRLTPGQTERITVDVPGQVAHFTVMLTEGQQFEYTLGRSGTRLANVLVLSPGVSSLPPQSGMWWSDLTLTKRFTATSTGIYTIVIDAEADASDTYHIASMLVAVSSTSELMETPLRDQ